jgi:UDPglucose 6-dehydrogenase
MAGDLGSARVATDALDAVAGADAVVLVTEWQELVDLDWWQVADAMAGTLVLDGRNALDSAMIVSAGLTYVGIGRPARSPMDA